MENQHRKITGYRELAPEEIDMMNAVKALGIEIGSMIEKLNAEPGFDQRWISIGKTDMQKGLMALTRAIAKPDFF